MFIKAPLKAVVDCLVKWGNQDEVGRFTRAARHRLRLLQATDLLAERIFNPDRAIVLPLSGAWTAFLDNHKFQYLANSELYILCKRLKTEGYYFLHDDREDSDHRGSAMFRADRFTDDTGDRQANLHDGLRVRQVMLYKESRWRFDQAGDPLPFEKLAAYALPKKRDRLTADILRGYGESLGIPFWNAEAYGQEVVLLRWGQTPESSGFYSALKTLIGVFGRPTFILDRHGLRKPPE
jgi:hypothetical protein